MEPIIIFGNGDIAELAKYYFESEGKYKIAAFTIDSANITEGEYLNLPIVPFENVEQIFNPSKYKLFIALSYSNMNKRRESKYNEGKEKGYSFVSCISKHATIANNVEIGNNCFLFENNTIQPFVKIGNNVTLWSGNHIGHHSVISDHCFISSHVVVSGGVIIESNCFIGVNATIRDHISIKKNCLIGAGCIILKSTEEEEVYIAERTKPSRYKSSQLENM
jgi:sugar O-acyltransferase (sialic acid O-acetyltransferase NeuD family)